MLNQLRYLLLQVRNPGDPMASHEVACFAAMLHCPEANIAVMDLMTDPPACEDIEAFDAVLLGGSGDYSVARGGPWLPGALGVMRLLHALAKPTFASCWGFQAMARALGAEVVTDLDRAEVGTLPLHLTDAGRADPVFGPLGSPFIAAIGHEDIVHTLPADAILLASSARTAHHAFRIADKPIYCTQFHPELTRDTLLDRLRAYPSYVEKISGLPYAEFIRNCQDTPATATLLERFAHVVLESREPAT